MKCNVIIGVAAITGLVMYYGDASAQTAPAEYNLKIKPVDLEMIGRGLGRLPFDEVAPLIQSLRSQVIEQQQTLSQQSLPPSPVPSITGEQPKK